MNALASWFLVMAAANPLSSAYSTLGPMTIEQCRAGEKAIASPNIHCRQPITFKACGEDSNTVNLCPVFDEAR